MGSSRNNIPKRQNTDNSQALEPIISQRVFTYCNVRVFEVLLYISINQERYKIKFYM